MTEINFSSQVHLVNIKMYVIHFEFKVEIIYYNHLFFINVLLTKDQETADMDY